MKEKITLIIPVYNEEETLNKLHHTLEEFFKISHIPIKVLFVDDGSDDNSALMIQNIIRGDDHYSAIFLKRNGGLSTAIKAGIDHTQTRWLAYMDSDLQTTPLDLVKYYEFMDSYEMINGIRVKRKDSFLKKISSKIANSFRRYLIKDNILDTCCPLKLIRTQSAKNMPFFKGMHRFIPALIQLQGGRVKEIEVQHFERFAGTAKYHLWNRLVGPFIDTLVFVWIRKRYISYKITSTEMTASYKNEKSFV